METLTQTGKRPTPQEVMWGPAIAKPAGIRAWNTGEATELFIPWTDLKSELDVQLLPQLFVRPTGYAFETRDYEGKKDWLVRIVKGGKIYCGVWFGKNPDKGWGYDGMVHIGDSVDPHEVWQSYQRYCDGTYLQLPSRVASLDELMRQR